MLKKCSQCKMLLGYSAFNKHASAKHGLQPYCRECARKYNAAYYGALRKAASPEQQRKRCRTCGDVKSLSEFHKRSAQKDGRRAECKECRRFSSRIERYGVAIDDPILRSTSCNNEGCRQQLRWDNSTHIDHCHKTGSVRGALCRKCNITLGHAGDDPEKLRGLADYAERANGNVAEAGDGAAPVVRNVSFLRRLLVAIFGLPARHGGSSHRRWAEQVER